MNSRSQRVINDPGPELVSPLSGPAYGAYSVAKRRWQKSIAAIIADGIANSRAVAARLERGMYMPDTSPASIISTYKINCFYSPTKHFGQATELPSERSKASSPKSE
jgi:hypothetical protein